MTLKRLFNYLTLFIITLNLTQIAVSSEELSKKELEEKKIELLLKAVESSEATFIRNGDKHTSKKAKSHLLFKYNKAKNMFWFFGPSKEISAVEFIEKIASKSSTTGEIYKILPKGSQKEVTTENWLKKRLKTIETDLMNQNPRSVSGNDSRTD